MPQISGLEILGEHPEAVGIELRKTTKTTITGVLVRECKHGIHLVERMKLDELVASGVREFAFAVQPLKLEGATGSTVAPVALH